MGESAIERRTQQLGRQLLARARRLGPSPLRAGWWDEHMMQWLIGQPALKGRMFRLIDVLPALPDESSVAAHLREYLGPTAAGASEERFARMVGRLVRAAPSRPAVAAFLRGVHRLGGRFIAGATADEAARAIRELRHRRRAASLDLLGEKVLSEREADGYAQQYLDLIESLSQSAANWPADPLLDAADAGRGIPRVNLSIKLSSLDSRFDPLARGRSIDAVLGRLGPIMRAARRRGAFLHVDMENYELRDLTLAAFERAAGDDEWAGWRDIGIVVQAYLKDSENDLERVLGLARRRGMPVTVRLVKGAYWDYENILAIQRNWPVPVWPRKELTDANFERLTRKLLEAGQWLDPAIASHNVRSLAAALAIAESLRLPAGLLECQMLYGMGEPIQAALVERNVRVRVYAPFGQLIPGMAYLTRRLLENTANESFLRQGFVERAAEDDLLRDPSTIESRHAGKARGCESVGEKQTSWSVRELPLAARAGGFVNAADTDISKEGARMKMQEAINRFRERMGGDYRPIIAGAAREGERVVPRENPANIHEVVGRIHWAGAADADAAVAAATDAQAAWADLPPQRRAELLRKLGDLVEDDRSRLVAAEIIECAKPWREADADVSEAVDHCRYYADQAVRWMSEPRRRDLPGEGNEYRYRPRGVGAIIAPWNFPLAILAGMSAAAVAAGNAVVLKPAEQSSAVAALFMELIERAGFPLGVFNYLPGAGETVGAHLVAHPGIDFVAFTGSWEVGRSIYAAAAANPSRNGFRHVVVETGGKNAIIVDADADADEAVGGIIDSAFGYSGQKCSACSRAIIVGAGYDHMLDRLIAAAEGLIIGPAENPGTMLGPLIDREALQRVSRYIDVGRSEARCVLATDVSHLAEGHYVGPTIFAEVDPSARIGQEEIFGPVLAVMRADSFEQAIDIANNVRFGLTGGVYSRSPTNVQRARQAMRVGNFYVNRPITGAVVDRQPFGGFKYSGLGSKAGGPDYLLQFLVPQTLTENTMRHGFAPPPAGSSGPDY